LNGIAIGAYTMSQMTAYNGRPFPAAVMLEEGGKVQVIRKRELRRFNH